MPQRMLILDKLRQGACRTSIRRISQVQRYHLSPVFLSRRSFTTETSAAEPIVQTVESGNLFRPSHGYEAGKRISDNGIPETEREQRRRLAVDKYSVQALRSEVNMDKIEAEIATGTTTYLYELLRKAASRGQGQVVERLVEHLVSERGEEPNLKLYEALMLANVSTEYGSAAKLHVLLQELADEGLAPDTSIYHTMLSVCRRPTSF